MDNAIREFADARFCLYKFLDLSIYPGNEHAFSVSSVPTARLAARVGRVGPFRALVDGPVSAGAQTPRPPQRCAGARRQLPLPAGKSN